MNYDELMTKLQTARQASGTDQMLVKVAIPSGDKLTFEHLDLVDVTVYEYHDSGQVDWVVYIKAEKKENK